MPEYRWLAPHHKLGQPAGFFVDELGQILFWPRSAAPGYVIDADAVVKLATEIPITITQIFVLVVGVVFTCGLFLFGRSVGPLIYPYISWGFSPNGGVMLLIEVNFVVFISILVVFTQHLSSKKLDKILHRYPCVDLPRPKIKMIKPSARYRRMGMVYVIFNLLILAISILMLVAASVFADLIIGDRLLCIANALLLGWGFIHLLRQQLFGLEPSQLRFAEPKILEGIFESRPHP